MTGERDNRTLISSENQESIERLIARVKSEADDGRITPAMKVLGKRNFVRGFFAAQALQTKEDLHNWFDSAVVTEYVGVWRPKGEALEGMREAVQLGLTNLSEEDINSISNSYKNIYPAEKYFISLA
ncbi:hypothetical protein A3F02_03050 [Candidatus Curtissbacteria bacterium RIFCSPHIGHO2_12_FULL_38_9b]|uniref:Uncharacterized protein n=2 Tax=Candidatus Curtissiibacteriota TaxID=1752717 RepID=A0A1F5GZ05_9BACT|nr:MAG: hypothetical protein A3A48_00920 [Candidatus Curtissbacteria bacterium RIFCSPLOWO2_01_FULL_37_9]OGD97152.1 MAG: hypothetical protein A3F02_03050 [Candidatus Curtissbacteria bacterium RIFCSPHIGHO2_12_FULL_38_9b]